MSERMENHEPLEEVQKSSAESINKPENIYTREEIDIPNDNFINAFEKNHDHEVDEAQKVLDDKYVAHAAEFDYEQNLKKHSRERNINNKAAEKKTMKQRLALALAALSVFFGGAAAHGGMSEKPNLDKTDQSKNGSIEKVFNGNHVSSEVQEALDNNDDQGLVEALKSVEQSTSENSEASSMSESQKKQNSEFIDNQEEVQRLQKSSEEKLKNGETLTKEEKNSYPDTSHLE